MSEHRFIIKPGVPGVYNLLTCEYCGITFRISPEDVICGSYLPRGNIEAMAQKQKCSRALQSKPPEDMLPAYDEDIEKLQKLLLKMSLLYDIYRNNKGGLTMKFTCQKCGKTIEVQPQVWRVYDGQRFCLSCREEVLL